MNITKYETTSFGLSAKQQQLLVSLQIDQTEKRRLLAESICRIRRVNKTSLGRYIVLFYDFIHSVNWQEHALHMVDMCVQFFVFNEIVYISDRICSTVLKRHFLQNCLNAAIQQCNIKLSVDLKFQFAWLCLPVDTCHRMRYMINKQFIYKTRLLKRK